MVKYLLATRFMKHDLKKYHRIVERVESLDIFQTWRKSGLVRCVSHPHLLNGCFPNIIGEFSGSRFQFSCRHFAVTYLVDPLLPLGSIWHKLRHITQRNQITFRVLQIIAKHQKRYFQSNDPVDLKLLPYEKITGDYQLRWPGEYIDASIISRVVNDKTVLDHNGNHLPLKELLPSKSRWISFRITRLLETDSPEMNDHALSVGLKNRFGVSVTSRYVGYCRTRMGIPSSRARLGNGPIVIRPTFWDLFGHLTGRSWSTCRMQPACTS